MASARDIIPIALAGVAGALGGRPAAASINQAASTARQMRLDKQEQERRDQIMANSARQLEMAEKSQARQERADLRAASRATMDKEKHEEQMRRYRETQAKLKAFQDSYIEANPDLPPHLKDLMLSSTDTYQARVAAEKISEWVGVKTPEEAVATARGLDLQPGESFSVPLEGGGRFGVTARSGQNVTPMDPNEREYGINLAVSSATRKVDSRIANLEQEAADLFDNYQNAMAGGDLVSNDDQDAAMQAWRKKKLEIKVAQEERQDAIRETLFKLGVKSSVIEEYLNPTPPERGPVEQYVEGGQDPVQQELDKVESKIAQGSTDYDNSPVDPRTGRPAPPSPVPTARSISRGNLVWNGNEWVVPDREMPRGPRR